MPSFTMIRGRRMRVTRLDGCGVPVIGAASTSVSSGFISVAFAAQTTEAEVIEVTNADGKICARDTGSPQFNGYNLDITFCGVEPCIVEMLTGQPVVTDGADEAIGFRMNSKVDQTAQGFALEVWTGVPGEACTSGAGTFGYILVPFVSSGVVGDFTVENAAINFTVTGASTKDGNGWGTGPYNVFDNAGTPSKLPTALDKDDHLYVAMTTLAPPAATDGCVALAAGFSSQFAEVA